MQEFTDAFEFWVAKDDSSKTKADALTSFESKAVMPKEKSEGYRLIIRMKESATDRYQGRTFYGIGITIYAVQANANVSDI